MDEPLPNPLSSNFPGAHRSFKKPENRESLPRTEALRGFCLLFPHADHPSTIRKDDGVRSVRNQHCFLVAACKPVILSLWMGALGKEVWVFLCVSGLEAKGNHAVLLTG